MRQSLGIYIHIPFCAERCAYCDFLTFPHMQRYHGPYIEALHQEIDLAVPDCLSGQATVDSIFFGGGTPSLLPANEITRILSHLRQRCTFSDDVEITVEANPGTFTASDLAIWKEGGVNRISLGVQSFSNSLLVTLGRTHTRKNVIESVHLLSQAGIRNWNADLMLGLPHQTDADIREDLGWVQRFSPSHISWYALILEEHTYFSYLVAQKHLSLPSEEETLTLMEEAYQGLSNLGYQRYEISNFAKEGKESRHNLKYWTGQDYLGLGVGAASYLSGERYENPRKLSRYLSDCKIGKPFAHKMVRDRKDDLFEQIMMGFRKIRGINRRLFFEKNGVDVLSLAPQTFRRVEAQGFLCVTDAKVAMTETGLAIQNDILSDILLEME